MALETNTELQNISTFRLTSSESLTKNHEHFISSSLLGDVSKFNAILDVNILTLCWGHRAPDIYPQSKRVSDENMCAFIIEKTLRPHARCQLAAQRNAGSQPVKPYGRQRKVKEKISYGARK